MSNKPDLISLQGELFLAKMINGQPSALLPIGNTPELQIQITSETTDHYESKTGLRAKDAVLRKQTGVSISGTLEEVTKENLAMVLSGKTLEIPEATVPESTIGAVKAGEMIDLGVRNLSDVAFKGPADAAITADKYILDAVFGTVVFNEAITDVKWSGKSGAITRTTIATNLGEEYRFFFKGVDTFQGDKIAVTLWRVELSPDTEFDLIHEEFASYSIEGECLADISKAHDAELSIFGHIERFSITP
ncbi:phage tail tube protein [Acinetobacter bohemicus]|jgi:hypothetical protein|uniref:phage tail tube protein n=1 Tax=Acinetobacter bohemicus TaxID=1435036 RepID=UPI00192BD0C7|nr:hypothetical protein [Acinetobacter bohemicus]CAD9197244.1 hypothetical protein QAC21B_03414 [Acinetobacter bohemicus]